MIVAIIQPSLTPAFRRCLGRLTTSLMLQALSLNCTQSQNLALSQPTLPKRPNHSSLEILMLQIHPLKTMVSWPIYPYLVAKTFLNLFYAFFLFFPIFFKKKLFPFLYCFFLTLFAVLLSLNNYFLFFASPFWLKPSDRAQAIPSRRSWWRTSDLGSVSCYWSPCLSLC